MRGVTTIVNRLLGRKLPGTKMKKNKKNILVINTIGCLKCKYVMGSIYQRLDIILLNSLPVLP